MGTRWRFKVAELSHVFYVIAILLSGFHDYDDDSIVALCDSLHGHPSLASLTIYGLFGTRGIHAIKQMLQLNESITHFSVDFYEMEETDSLVEICQGLETNSAVSSVYLNADWQFLQELYKALARLIKQNNTLRDLEPGWLYLGDGAMTMATARVLSNAVACNTTLESFVMPWDGFDDDHNEILLDGLLSNSSLKTVGFRRKLLTVEQKQRLRNHLLFNRFGRQPAVHPNLPLDLWSYILEMADIDVIL
jgi:hypothetical protein